ncbi:MAG: type II toxin-antitoxin system VapC family toxin [Promethearchaeota archaeon]
MIIADTTVLIDIWRGRPAVKQHLEKYKKEILCISVISIAELYDGLGYTKEKKGDTIYKKIKDQIEKILSGFHIMPINIQILQESGIIKGRLRAKGIILDMADCIIGITAKIMNVDKIITRNESHFQEFGIDIESYALL